MIVKYSCIFGYPSLEALLLTVTPAAGAAVPECPQLRVTNADFAECNGDYLYSYSLRVSWAPDRPVYVHTDR